MEGAWADISALLVGDYNVGWFAVTGVIVVGPGRLCAGHYVCQMGKSQQNEKDGFIGEVHLA